MFKTDSSAGGPSCGTLILLRVLYVFLALLAEFEARRSELPDDEDLDGVVSAVLRLQDTYQLPAAKIADGTFSPRKLSPPMTGIAMDSHLFYQGSIVTIIVSDHNSADEVFRLSKHISCFVLVIYCMSRSVHFACYYFPNQRAFSCLAY